MREKRNIKYDSFAFIVTAYSDLQYLGILLSSYAKTFPALLAYCPPLRDVGLEASRPSQKLVILQSIIRFVPTYIFIDVVHVVFTFVVDVM